MKFLLAVRKLALKDRLIMFPESHVQGVFANIDTNHQSLHLIAPYEYVWGGMRDLCPYILYVIPDSQIFLHTSSMTLGAILTICWSSQPEEIRFVLASP
jgi:hypothetical protein